MLSTITKKSGYRRLNGQCWRRATTPSGQYSGLWVPACAIDEFVLEHLSEESLPTLVRCQSKFTLLDGAYDADRDIFYEYDKDVVPDDFVAYRHVPTRFRVNEDVSTPYFDLLTDQQKERLFASVGKTVRKV